MRRWESREKSSARRCSAAWLYERLSSRMAPRIERSASTLAGRLPTRLKSVVATSLFQGWWFDCTPNTHKDHPTLCKSASEKPGIKEIFSEAEVRTRPRKTIHRSFPALRMTSALANFCHLERRRQPESKDHYH